MTITWTTWTVRDETLSAAKTVFTTEEGAGRLGGNSIGLFDWETRNVSAPDGRVLRIVAAPARYGPEGMSRGAVIGFVLFFEDEPQQAVYVSGDTVWYPGVEDVAQRFPIQAAILHLGAARVKEVGPFHLTMTSAEGVEAARAFSNAKIVPVHFEDWAHFSEGRDHIARAFADAHLEHRLQWPKRGQTISIDMDGDEKVLRRA